MRRPMVKPETAREWLRRYEVEGEPLSKIAKTDFYDVRTVRSQIERARLEREVREARHVVLRGALEKHYVDLCSFAKKLKEDLSGDEPKNISPALKEDPMWQSLHEHLPRVRLWKDIEKWQKLVSDYEKSVAMIKERTRIEAASKSSLEFVSSANTVGLIDGFPEAMSFHLKAVALGWQGLASIDYKMVNNEYGVWIGRGGYGLALVPEAKLEEIQVLFNTMMDEALEWEEYSILKKLTEESLRIKKDIHGELTKIILRRIVPGKCVYCPF